jgi:antirestriction protein ArdC
MSKDIYELITARFIEQLKKGTVPWQKPWMGVQNIVSKKPYRGINALILGGSAFQSPYWLTFKQAHDLGGKVKKGEQATPVIYYKLFEKRDDQGNLVIGSNGRTTRIPFTRLKRPPRSLKRPRSVPSATQDLRRSTRPERM